MLQGEKQFRFVYQKQVLGKANIIFSDSIFGDGLQEGLTSFQLFKLAAPNSSMAPSYEHSSA